MFSEEIFSSFSSNDRLLKNLKIEVYSRIKVYRIFNDILMTKKKLTRIV